MNDVNHTTIQPPPIAWKRLFNEFIWVVLAAVLFLAVLLLAEYTAVSYWVAPLRFVLGGLFVLYFPGYCLTATLFPRQTDLDSIERLGLSVGLSIAWVSLLALIINWLPFGFQFWPIIWGELGSVGVFVLTAVLRRSQLALNELFTPAPILPRQWWQTLTNLERRILLVCALAVVLVGVGFGVTSTAVLSQDSLTEFYILSPDGSAENFPQTVPLTEPVSLTIGINNDEIATQSYRIEVIQQDIWSGDSTLLHTVEDISLSPGDAWQAPLEWHMAQAGSNQQVSIYLFVDKETEPYRRLRLWLDVQE